MAGGRAWRTAKSLRAAGMLLYAEQGDGISAKTE